MYCIWKCVSEMRMRKSEHAKAQTMQLWEYNHNFSHFFTHTFAHSFFSFVVLIKIRIVQWMWEKWRKKRVVGIVERLKHYDTFRNTKVFNSPCNVKPFFVLWSGIMKGLYSFLFSLINLLSLRFFVCVCLFVFVYVRVCSPFCSTFTIATLWFQQLGKQHTLSSSVQNL